MEENNFIKSLSEKTKDELIELVISRDEVAQFHINKNKKLGLIIQEKDKALSKLKEKVTNKNLNNPPIPREKTKVRKENRQRLDQLRFVTDQVNELKRKLNSYKTTDNRIEAMSKQLTEYQFEVLDLREEVSVWGDRYKKLLSTYKKK